MTDRRESNAATLAALLAAVLTVVAAGVAVPAVGAALAPGTDAEGGAADAATVAGTAGTAPAAGSVGATDAATVTGTAGDAGAVTATQAAPAAPTFDCTNGTSDSVVACGYDPGPTDVELGSQSTDGANITVRAVELSEGGFVAVHTVEFVDGAFTTSVLGTSGYLPAGLHRDVAVELDESVDANATLLAVVYRDGDADRRFEFAATDGGVDRPYTNTYSERYGNVTDDAGKVVGDPAPVTVEGSAGVARFDADGDGVIDLNEVLRAITAFNTGLIVGTEPVDLDDVLRVVTAFDS